MLSSEMIVHRNDFSNQAAATSLFWNIKAILNALKYTHIIIILNIHRSNILEINIYKLNTVVYVKAYALCVCVDVYIRTKGIIINSFSVLSFMFHSINFIVAVISWTKHSQNTMSVSPMKMHTQTHILYRETIFDLFKFSLHLCNALWTLHSQLVSTLYYQMKEILFGICSRAVFIYNREVFSYHNYFF